MFFVVFINNTAFKLLIFDKKCKQNIQQMLIFVLTFVFIFV